MSTRVAGSRPANALSTLWNLIVAPSAAFEALRERPTWVVACVVLTVATIVATIMMQPALSHAMLVALPAEMARTANGSSLTPEQRSRAISVALALVRFGWIWAAVAVFIGICIDAVILLAAAAIGRGEANFARLFALAMNVGVVWLGIGGLVAAGIVMARGPEAFSATYELNLAVPSLGWLAWWAPPKVMGFLGGINPFSVWAFFLLGSGMASVAKVRAAVGYSAAGFLVLCGCGFLALGVR